MKTTFLHSLWGDGRVDRRSRIVAEIAVNVAHPWRTEPLMVATFGRDNDDLVRKLGYATEMLDESPVVDWLGTGKREPDTRANINYGAIMWWHKIAAMRWAMQEREAIVWLDWDCRLTRPLDADFWDRMAVGAAIQITLVEYRKIQCWWRKEDKRKLGEGAFIYCRDRAILDRVWKKYREHPTLVDQQVIAMLMDEMCGGWPGIQGWLDRGFEPYCHELAGIHNVFQHQQPLFRTARPRRSSVKTHIEGPLHSGGITSEQAKQIIREKFPHLED